MKHLIMKTNILSLAGSLALLIGSLASRAAVLAPPAKAEQAPVVQIPILLDTSGSMQGLIEQAKGQLWKIVNEFINAKQNGRQPELEVALFEYGKDTLPASTGYIRMIAPLTNDLDKFRKSCSSCGPAAA